MNKVFECGDSVLLRTNLPYPTLTPDRLTLGITGGIGSGKTFISKSFANNSVEVIDADQIARQLTVPGTSAMSEIAAAFPEADLFNDQGELRREVLASLIFSNSQNQARLDRIMLPKIVSKIQSRLDAHTEGLLVVDAPLLFETNLDRLLNICCVVSADLETRLARLVARGISRTDAMARINAQFTDRQRLPRAHWQLLNNGKAADTLACAQELYRQLT